MPAKDISINLLGDSAMDHTPVGRIVTWAVTYGRYIMIGTEIVVLLAFISRFSLDRKLTDLKEEVTQKQDIIQANIELETEVRTLQSRLATIKTLVSKPSEAAKTLTIIQSALPPEVHLNTLEIDSGKVSADAIATTSQGFSQFIANIQAASGLSSIDIGDITRSPTEGIKFSFTAVYQTAPLKK